MGKVDPKGQYFAGGQSVNSFGGGGGGGDFGAPVRAARQSTKQLSQDRSALAKLGVVTMPAVEKKLGSESSLERASFKTV